MSSLILSQEVSFRRQIRHDICEETLKYRSLLDQYLECLAKEWNLPTLRMNHQGICTFCHEQFLIVLEVPTDSSCFFLYTCVYHCTSKCTAIMKKALELNYLTQETCGCTLSLDPTMSEDDHHDDDMLQLTLSYSQPIMGLNREELCTIVINFIETTSYLHFQLHQHAIITNTKAITSSMEHQENITNVPAATQTNENGEHERPASSEVTHATSNKTRNSLVETSKVNKQPDMHHPSIRSSARVDTWISPEPCCPPPRSTYKNDTITTSAPSKSRHVPASNEVTKNPLEMEEQTFVTTKIATDMTTSHVVCNNAKTTKSVRRISKRTASIYIARPQIPQRRQFSTIKDAGPTFPQGEAVAAHW